MKLVEITARTAMVDVAVAEGYNVIVLPGYVFAQTVIDTTFKYPDIKFIVLDMSASDIGAAAEMGITDKVTIEYAYGGQFYGSTEITAAMDTWYSNETEVVFACVGGIFTSAAEAAAKVNGKIIGVDSDQSPIIDKYGKGMTVPSAMKSLTATVNARLDSIIFDGTWKDHVGQVENLGLVSKDDMSKNYVGLPEDTTQWNKNFGVNDYKKLVAEIFDGKRKVNNSTDQMPKVSVKLNERQGMIK